MTEFQRKLKKLMDEYVHFVYDATKKFPKEELYNSTSQWKRSTLSMILNYIEGYARRKLAVQLNFFEISYGSLNESKYILDFSFKRKFINYQEFQKGYQLSEEISKMLWSEVISVETRIKQNTKVFKCSYD